MLLLGKEVRRVMLVQKLNRLTQRRMIITFLIILFLLQIIVPSVIADNEEDTQSKIEEIIDETVSKSGASKISVGCFKDNDVKYYGQENNELYYQIGYTAREFISLGILSLVESETIALEDSASDYIEGFNPQYNGSDCVVTIENLLTQSSGLDSSNVRYIKSS